MKIDLLVTRFLRQIASLSLIAVLVGCTTTLDVPQSAFVSQSEYLALNARIAKLAPGSQNACLDKYDRSQDSGDLVWCESYALNDIIDQFEKDGDAENAATIIAHVKRLKAAYNRTQEDALRKRVVGGWVSKKFTKGRPHVWAVHTGMLAHPIARFVAVIRRTNNSTYKAEAQSMLAFAKEAYAAMEPDWRNGFYIYPGSGLHRAKGSPLPYNMQAAMGLLALYLYQADPAGQSYLSRAKRIAQRIDDATEYRVVGGKRRLVWSYDESSGAEDTSHAILTMSFITRMYDAGLIFRSKRFNAILSSFLDGSIGKGSLTNGNLVSEGTGGSFQSTCHRALVIYRHHRPTFARCR